MTISLGGLGISLGATSSGTGAVAVSPDRLLSFSESPITLPAPAGTPAQAQLRYTFRINPSKLSTTHEKLERYQITKFGWERQSWGAGLTIFRYSGTSGVFRPDGASIFSAFGAAQPFDIRTSIAWQKFREFEDFYRRTGRVNIFMFYLDYPHEWEGSLNDFSFERSATNPFAIDYSFKFTALPIDYAPTTASIGLPTGDVGANQALAASATPFLGTGGSVGL